MGVRSDPRIQLLMVMTNIHYILSCMCKVMRDTRKELGKQMRVIDEDGEYRTSDGKAACKEI